MNEDDDKMNRKITLHRRRRLPSGELHMHMRTNHKQRDTLNQLPAKENQTSGTTVVAAAECMCVFDVRLVLEAFFMREIGEGRGVRIERPTK